ncbi:hypothetical protein MMC20_006253 [Loxospora ochrophaea]|nr:hypothetical protein [Loxospora ochrophaea]
MALGKTTPYQKVFNFETSMSLSFENADVESSCTRQYEPGNAHAQGDILPWLLHQAMDVESLQFNLKLNPSSTQVTLEPYRLFPDEARFFKIESWEVVQDVELSNFSITGMEVLHLFDSVLMSLKRFHLRNVGLTLGRYSGTIEEWARIADSIRLPRYRRIDFSTLDIDFIDVYDFGPTKADRQSGRVYRYSVGVDRLRACFQRRDSNPLTHEFARVEEINR